MNSLKFWLRRKTEYFWILLNNVLWCQQTEKLHRAARALDLSLFVFTTHLELRIVNKNKNNERKIDKFLTKNWK